MLITFNTFFFTLLLFCAFVALGQWRLSRDAAIPWYIGYLAATFLHYGRQFWIDVSGRPGVPALPDPPLEWDTPLSYAAFACYFLFVREMMAIWHTAPRLSKVLVALGRFLGLMSAGHLAVQAAFGHASAETVHQVFQVVLFPVLLWLTWNTLRNARLFYQKLILAGTAALVLGFLCVVLQRRLSGDYMPLPDMLCCFPTRWGHLCLYHLKVGVALDVFCFSWAIALRQKKLLLEAIPVPMSAGVQPSAISLTELSGDPEDHATAETTKDDTLLGELDALLAQHFHCAEFRIGDMAAGVNTSPGNLNRRIKKATGLTTEQYLLRYRLERAKEMLLAGGMSVTEVMEAAGFSDSAHFSRAFKKCYGINPSALLNRGNGGKIAV